jgi:hypothetical protein
MTEDAARTTPPDLEDLRLLLGIGEYGEPTLQARQAVGLIRHPHTPWIPGDTAEDRLGALLVSPLALALRNTAWEGLLAEELTGHGPNRPDLCLAERARLAGTSIPQLITALRPVLDLFDEPNLAFEFAAEHTKILFPEFYECAELWSGVFNEYVEDSSPAADEERATRSESWTTSPIPTCTRTRKPAGSVSSAKSRWCSPPTGPRHCLTDCVCVTRRHRAGRPGPSWSPTTLRRSAAIAPPRRASISRGSTRPGNNRPPFHRVLPRLTSRSVLAQLFEAYGDEPLDPSKRPPGIGLARYVRDGFRYWHVWGTYSQLYDVLLTAAHSVGSEEILDPRLAALLAEYVYGYLYIGYKTGTESLHLQEITDLPMSGWEVRSLFPEIRDLMAIRHTEPLIESFARTRMPAAFGLAPLIGEIAELLALATTDTDLSNAMLHLGAAPDAQPPQSWRTWLTDLSADAVRVAAASVLNREP